MEQLFQKYEKKLKLQNVQARIWEEKHTYIKSGKAVFKVPNPPKQERTFRWVIGKTFLSFLEFFLDAL